MPSPGTLADPGQTPGFDDVTLTDDRAMRYAVRVGGMSIPPELPGQARESASLSLRLQPVPGRSRRWLELRNRDGAATRLVPSARPAVRVAPLAPASASPAERELSELARGVIGLELTGIDAGARARHCSAVLARAAQIRRSGELDTASELPDQLARLCDALTGHGPASGLPPGWSRMLNAAQRADGPRHHLDIPAALPAVDGTAVQLGTIVSEPQTWRLYLRARPGWWTYSQDHRRKWAAMSVHAGDDTGGMYLSSFGGSTGHRHHEELALQFRPRLDPLAHILTLTFSGAGGQVAVRIRLPSDAVSAPR